MQRKRWPVGLLSPSSIDPNQRRPLLSVQASLRRFHGRSGSGLWMRLVAPVAWEEAGSAHWDVTLHCPNCDWLGSGVFAEEVVERFDEELDRGTEALVRDLQRLMRANMEDEIDRFAAALAADQIWPMDF